MGGVKFGEQVQSSVRRRLRANTQRINEIQLNRNGLGIIAGEIQCDAVIGSPTCFKQASGGSEAQLFVTFSQFPQDMSGRQGAAAAQREFRTRAKPSQV